MNNVAQILQNSDWLCALYVSGRSTKVCLAFTKRKRSTDAAGDYNYIYVLVVYLGYAANVNVDSGTDVDVAFDHGKR